MSINGIPIKLMVSTEHGDDIETAYFATARKSPAVKAAVKGCARLENEGRILSRKLAVVDREMDAANDSAQIDALGDRRSQITEALLEFSDKADEARRTLALAGFTAAGYDQATAARLAESVPDDRFSELLSAAQAGGSAMDFTKAATE